MLVLFLYLARPREGRSDMASHFDFKTLFYQERDGRIRVVSPTFLYKHAVNPDLSFKIEGIFNTISGATPTGTPPAFLPVVIPAEVCVASVVSTGSSGGSDDDEYGYDDEHEDEREDEHEDEDNDRRWAPPKGYTWHTKAGATPSGGGGGSSGGGGGSTTVYTCQPVEPPEPIRGTETPYAEVEDTRVGLNLEVSKRVGRQTFVVQFAHSTEDDYDSYGLAFSDAIAMNGRNTTLLLGGAYTYDRIRALGVVDDTKQTVDVILGLSQVLGPKTLITLNLTASHSTGYLSDPYKLVEINREWFYEKRPDERDKLVIYTALTRYIAWLKASAELSYRRYQDSNGISANTTGFAWYQRVGRHLIVRPRVRFYDQTAADFFAYFFEGDPEYYSSDYRVSALQAVGYGVKVIWNPTERLTFDVGYDHYEQEGTDDVLPDEVYPSADFITAGVRLWL